MLKGSKLTIRPIKEKDLDEFFCLFNSVRLQVGVFFEELGSEYQFKKNYQKTGFWGENKGTALIVDQEEKIIGVLWFSKIVPYFDSLELSYIIFKEKERGKGYMTESLSLFSAYLFATKKINRLQLSIPDYHRASIAVAQKCGYTFEGIARQAVFNRGKYTDLCLYSLLREECKNIDKLFE
jgi:RimJ/RimL family protein N-acetyltransferase